MKHYGDTAIGLKPGERKNPATRLRNLYMLALGLIGCLAIASQLVVQRALLKQESDAPVINIAGRQRVLSQKLAKCALTTDEILDHCKEGGQPRFVACDELELCLLNLHDVLNLWTRSHLGLQQGDPELALPGTNSPEVTALFEKIEPDYRAMRYATERLLASVEGAAPPRADPNLSRPYVSIILNHEGPFLTGMNDIVFQYETEAQARVARLKRTELALLWIILSVLSLEAVLVFAPAVRTIRRQFTRVRESEAWLATVLKSIGDAVIATDPEGFVRFMNPVAEGLTGWNQDDAIGRPLSEVFVIVNEKTGQRAENPITKVLAEGIIVGLANHTALISKDGTKRSIDDSAAPLKDDEGRVSGAVLVFRDVTERRRAGRSLRESEELHRVTLSSISDTVLITDDAGTFTYVCPNVQVIFGYSAQEVRQLGNISKLLVNGFQESVGAGEARDVRNIEHRVADKSGKTHVLLTSVKRVSIKAGTLLYTCRDITERKQAEEAVRDAEERLVEQRRREKERVEAELEKTRGQLVTRTRLATIGQVSASVAHELRNPLGTVRNAAYLLKRHVPHNEGKWAEYLGIIDEEVNRADRTICNLMEMARPKKPTAQRVNLADIVREAFDLANAPEGVRCRASLGVDPFLIHVDPSQLRQVLINLLTNAAQAVGEGPISGRSEIVVEARHENGYDRIVVRDSGPGVPTEHRGQLFEPLFSTKAKGTGLGLTICRQIIEQHGGTIEFVEPDEGGAAFEIRLPSRGTPESSESGEAICQHGKRSRQEHRF